MIKAVIFDCFGVLIGDAYMVIRKKYPELSPRITGLGVESNLGRITSLERRERTVEMLNEIGARGQVVLREAIDGITRNTELLGEIKRLREKFKTGLLSNAGEGFWRRFSEQELKEYFDTVVVSYQVGLVKPDPRIFELTADRLGVEMDECVFVDDDASNVRAAESCGMRGIVYEWGMDVAKSLA